MKNSIKRFYTEESGATSVEYALIAALIAVALVAALQLFAKSRGDMFIFISETINSGTQP
jgi:pilus assembly protein Flp/PilA